MSPPILHQSRLTDSLYLIPTWFKELPWTVRFQVPPWSQFLAQVLVWPPDPAITTTEQPSWPQHRPSFPPSCQTSAKSELFRVNKLLERLDLMCFFINPLFLCLSFLKRRGCYSCRKQFWVDSFDRKVTEKTVTARGTSQRQSHGLFRGFLLKDCVAKFD